MVRNDPIVVSAAATCCTQAAQNINKMTTKGLADAILQLDAAKTLIKSLIVENQNYASEVVAALLRLEQSQAPSEEK